MQNDNDFKILVASDIDYERLIIFFKYDSNTIAVLDCEQGFDEANINFFNYGKVIFQLNYRNFIEVLELAYNTLKGLNQTHLPLSNHCSPIIDTNNFQVRKSESTNDKIVLILKHRQKNLFFISHFKLTNEYRINLLNDSNKIVWDFELQNFIKNLKESYKALITNNTPLPPV
ncbi:hypothetical protein [Candidatus Protochlamydia phocaeensis]|uniref:hypothetical protein n=1 Tax=Candidatus Protochlamydia phocaeensis TaxID=1414722 RepID=UPI0008391DB8|nr:hypothetical protein [Candidatus Protochlamydia phocaeensis]